MTRRNVHSHHEHAPISKKQYQVTGYGEVILQGYLICESKLRIVDPVSGAQFL